MSEKKAVILLSGGLDSVVSMALKYKDIKLALTFDYGQRSAKQEIEASKDVCGYYGIEHKVIELPWLKEITKSALVDKNKNLEFEELGLQSAKSVWVPNRNGVFINIAACFCDSFGFNEIIIGANSEEAQTFSDNSAEFIGKINEALKLSTLVKPEVVAPLINMNKVQIVKEGLKNLAPMQKIKSCYEDKIGHCSRCESCMRLKNALFQNGCENLIKTLFNI